MLTGEGCLETAPHKNFECKQNRNPKYFFLVMEQEATPIWECQGLNLCLDYVVKEKDKLDKVL